MFMKSQRRSDNLLWRFVFPLIVIWSIHVSSPGLMKTFKSTRYALNRFCSRIYVDERETSI